MPHDMDNFLPTFELVVPHQTPQSEPSVHPMGSKLTVEALRARTVPSAELVDTVWDIVHAKMTALTDKGFYLYAVQFEDFEALLRSKAPSEATRIQAWNAFGSVVCDLEQHSSMDIRISVNEREYTPLRDVSNRIIWPSAIMSFYVEFSW